LPRVSRWSKGVFLSMLRINNCKSLRCTVSSWIAVCAMWVLSASALAGSITIENARIWNAPDHSRLVLEVSGGVKHKIMVLESPDRLVVDLDSTSNKTRFDLLDIKGSPIKGIRSARRNDRDLRVVLDLKGPVSPRSFLLKPNEQYGNRLVVDLYDKGKRRKTVSAPKTFSPVGGKRDVVIVVDPGHGGEDPGAVGPGRVLEKDVVLAISKELVTQLNAKKGFSARLTRNSDYYIRLRKRTQIARDNNADLLVSVHADAFNKAQANGASVFALSNSGASSETARWLAKKENAADLIGGVGGVSLDGKDDVLAGVLLDLSSTASLKASLGVGDFVLKSLGKVSRLHKSRVQQAGFVVLKSPDIPSILVETGFISNPAESRRLNTRKYQRSIAKSIATGVSQHFEKAPPPGSYLAWRQQGSPAVDGNVAAYTVRKGDTLSHIAAKNSVSVSRLRSFNGLRSDRLTVGQRLRVPTS
jgi:N-acetylmuramoyl-L-alanine amidase